MTQSREAKATESLDNTRKAANPADRRSFLKGIAMAAGVSAAGMPAIVRAQGQRELTFIPMKSAGGMSVKVLLPQDLQFKELVRVQEILYTDVLKEIGLGSHPNCLSGLDAVIMEEQFVSIVRGEL